MTLKGLFGKNKFNVLLKLGACLQHHFNILTNVQYYQVKVARDEKYIKALEVGLVKTIKRFDVLTIGEEKKLLAYNF